MTGYYDPAEAAAAVYRERQRRRQRLEAALRGWLIVHASPRWTTFILLCGAIAVATGFASWAHGIGLSAAFSAIYAVPLMWLVFIALLRWRAGAELTRLDLDQS